jgi:hypothetical protein
MCDDRSVREQTTLPSTPISPDCTPWVTTGRSAAREIWRGEHADAAGRRRLEEAPTGQSTKLMAGGATCHAGLLSLVGDALKAR